jgi:hypothetical protein
VSLQRVDRIHRFPFSNNSIPVEGFVSCVVIFVRRCQITAPITAAMTSSGIRTAATMTPVLILSSGAVFGTLSFSIALLPSVPALTGAADVSAVIVLGEILLTLLVVIVFCISLVNVLLSENVDVIFVDIVFISASEFTLTSYDTLWRGERDNN